MARQLNVLGRQRIFSKCLLCGRHFVQTDIKTGKEQKILSAYPLCVECMKKTRDDPAFQKWIAKKIHVSKTNNN